MSARTVPGPPSRRWRPMRVRRALRWCRSPRRSNRRSPTCRMKTRSSPSKTWAWTSAAGATAPQAAGVIHSDFERGFIRAEVAAYDDFVAHGGEQGAKEAGKLRLEGKDYVVRDGDVIHFRFNV